MLILVFPTINQVECRLDLDFAFFKYIAFWVYCGGLLQFFVDPNKLFEIP